MSGPAPAKPAIEPQEPPARTSAKPRFRRSQPIGTYSQGTLVALVDHIESDTLLRTEDQLIRDLMRELGLQRRSKNIVAALTAAVRTSRSRRQDGSR
jgi:hypothetical protein